MRALSIASVILLACASAVSSKDKAAKISFEQMVGGMRDAFNCGVVVEKYLHGSLKDNPDEYHKLRQENNCEHVESVLNTQPEQH